MNDIGGARPGGAFVGDAGVVDATWADMLAQIAALVPFTGDGGGVDAVAGIAAQMSVADAATGWMLTVRITLSIADTGAGVEAILAMYHAIADSGR